MTALDSIRQPLKIFFSSCATGTIQNTYMYQYHNTEHVRVMLDTGDTSVYCQGTYLSDCFTG